MKSLLKTQPVLFKIWYHLYRKHKGVKINYFNSKTKFLLDGYPRSGNTFFTGLSKSIFGKEEFIHHFHAIAPIKMALKRNLPCFILVREPQEAITSWYLKTHALKKVKLSTHTNISLLKKLASDYRKYYDFVDRNFEHLHVLVFEEVISEPEKVLHLINEKVFNHKRIISKDSIDHFIHNEYKGATDILGSSKPNETKEKLKKKLKQELLKLDEYPKCIEVYNALVNASLK